VRLCRLLRRRDPDHRRPPTLTFSRAYPVATWWNNAPCKAVPVFVEVGQDMTDPRHAWAITLAGTIRWAVRIDYFGRTFYIDNDDGSGWYKVTHGGGKQWPHRRLPVAREVGI
jgi:hypothetical protein